MTCQFLTNRNKIIKYETVVLFPHEPLFTLNSNLLTTLQTRLSGCACLHGEMLVTHTYAQLCVTTRQMTSCSLLECVSGLCGDTLTNHNSPCDELWHKIVHKCVSPAFLHATMHIQIAPFAVWSTNYCLNKIGVRVGKERQKIIFSL